MKHNVWLNSLSKKCEVKNGNIYIFLYIYTYIQPMTHETLRSRKYILKHLKYISKLKKVENIYNLYICIYIKLEKICTTIKLEK